MTPSKQCDVVILGTGPAGIQAAIHAARKKVSVVMLGRQAKSSLFHAHVENFCCVFDLAGEDMIRTGREQALKFGAEIREEDVMAIAAEPEGFAVTVESGDTLRCKSLVVATGSERNTLRVPGEKALLGKGVSYCVECDANFFKGETVAVVGGESAAASGALTLLHYATEVHLVCERLSVADALRRQVSESGIHLHEGAKVVEITGETAVTGLTLDNGATIDVTGVFIELGAKGVMSLATALGIQLDDEMRFIHADKQQATNVAGVYAAGDVCGPPWQMAKAVGEGCVAGIYAATYARKH